jgi:hypothetical protein
MRFHSLVFDQPILYAMRAVSVLTQERIFVTRILYYVSHLWLRSPHAALAIKQKSSCNHVTFWFSAPAAAASAALARSCRGGPPDFPA